MALGILAPKRHAFPRIGTASIINISSAGPDFTRLLPPHDHVALMQTHVVMTYRSPFATLPVSVSGRYPFCPASPLQTGGYLNADEQLLHTPFLALPFFHTAIIINPGKMFASCNIFSGAFRGIKRMLRRIRGKKRMPPRDKKLVLQEREQDECEGDERQEGAEMGISTRKREEAAEGELLFLL
ncbi:hypothetical protein BDQ17DRAFT_1425615 [Cyathus striatus]|nr:hypothetical protein BDQ17DRAFT_1425615 [Cyathus striatus]